MKISTKQLLARLGSGATILDVCKAAGIDREEFDATWRAEAMRRVPAVAGSRAARVRSGAEIVRDEWGIPHILATSDDDLFFAYGYAMAQDRLFQLDYLRRRAWGRLAEVWGPEAIELDILARTVGLGRIALGEWDHVTDETRRLVTAFTAGVNALMADSREHLPVEFDLLDYQPEAWRETDCLAIAVEFRWYLTGRFPVIVIPELVGRALSHGPLYEAFLQAEADEESVLARGAYPRGRVGVQPVAGPVGDPRQGEGSNNWVIAPSKTVTGHPLLASDPHIAFAAVSCWYEAHLCGGSFNVAGMTYAGMPAILFGRNERVAWGITNNICSQRDLYQERTDPAHPGCFLYDGRYEKWQVRQELIAVRGGKSVERTIRTSRNGPIVDEILPAAARDRGPVALKWLGAQPCGWLDAVLAMDRAATCGELREAMRPWHVPTFNVVFADVEGRVGHQCSGRIPIRNVLCRGYRPGWDPAHQWAGLIPFEGMPRLDDPPHGYIVTANNRTAPDDFPYPLAGTWTSGHRARRIRQMIESCPRLAFADLATMQQDALSLRAVECKASLLSVLEAVEGHTAQMARSYLIDWDCVIGPDSVAATIFDLFFGHWCQAVAKRRFEGPLVPLAAGAAAGLASQLLKSDPAGWFSSDAERTGAIRAAFFQALDEIERRLGPGIEHWMWGSLHRLTPRHVLSGRGDLGLLLDLPSVSVRGDMTTVCNTGNDASWQAGTGAGYRMLVDLATSPAEMWAVDAGSSSGHPGSPHYDDQMSDWLAARYHRVPLDPKVIDQLARTRLRLEPANP